MQRQVFVEKRTTSLFQMQRQNSDDNSAIGKQDVRDSELRVLGEAVREWASVNERSPRVKSLAGGKISFCRRVVTIPQNKPLIIGWWHMACVTGDICGDRHLKCVVLSVVFIRSSTTCGRVQDTKVMMDF